MIKKLRAERKFYAVEFVTRLRTPWNFYKSVSVDKRDM